MEEEKKKEERGEEAEGRIGWQASQILQVAVRVILTNVLT